MKKLEYIARIHTDFPTKIWNSKAVGTCKYKRNNCIRARIPQRRGTKRAGRIFASVADLGIFRGGQGELESDGTSAETWRE